MLQENRALRQASVHIQAKAEQEEEFISNTLLKKIQALKKEKENLALNYEQEEECLTNDLSRKLNQVLDFTKKKGESNKKQLGFFSAKTRKSPIRAHFRARTRMPGE